MYKGNLMMDTMIVNQKSNIFSEINEITPDILIRPHYYIFYVMNQYIKKIWFYVVISFYILALISGWLWVLIIDWTMPSNFATDFKTVLIGVSLLLCIALFLLIPLYPIIRKSMLKKYFSMAESLSNGDFNLLQEEIIKFERTIDLNNPQEINGFYKYFKSITLIYSKKYDIALKMLESLKYWKSFAMYYEVLLLKGHCYYDLGNIERAQELYLESLTGFKKIKFHKAIEYLTS